MEHAPSKQTFSYKRKKKDDKVQRGASTSSNNQEKESSCASYFLHSPTEWMGEHHQEGKIYCPKCTTRVGAFSWSGSQCSCGSWIAPSISFPKSRVDEKSRTETAVTQLVQQVNQLALVSDTATEPESKPTEVQTENKSKLNTEPTFDPVKVSELEDMGFEVPLIKVALSKNEHQVSQAMLWLFSPEAMNYVANDTATETQNEAQPQTTTDAEMTPSSSNKRRVSFGSTTVFKNTENDDVQPPNPLIALFGCEGFKNPEKAASQFLRYSCSWLHTKQPGITQYKQQHAVIWQKVLDTMEAKDLHPFILNDLIMELYTAETPPNATMWTKDHVIQLSSFK